LSPPRGRADLRLLPYCSGHRLHQANLRRSSRPGTPTALWGTLILVTKLQIQENVELAPYTTMGIGGPARFFTHVQTERKLEAAASFAEKNSLPLVVLGGGSNLLVRDEGFPGLVVFLDLCGETRISPAGSKVRFDVPAGTEWDDFVLSACEHGLSGVECLAGIPGRSGGSPVQNIGAYGQEVAQTIQSVRAYDLRLRLFVVLSNEACGFTYRSSRFNTEERGRYLITNVSFLLQTGEKSTLTYADLQARFAGQTPSPLQIYHAVREIRQNKGMLFLANDPDSRSAGSFFKNPVVPADQLSSIAAEVDTDQSAVPHWPAPNTSQGDPQVKLAAAWLVQSAGFPKGFADGAAGISSRHSLALINRGGATFSDIARLRDRIQAEVTRRFGVRLDQEPVELAPQTGKRF